jgi:hypothetical protein
MAGFWHFRWSSSGRGIEEGGAAAPGETSFFISSCTRTDTSRRFAQRLYFQHRCNNPSAIRQAPPMRRNGIDVGASSAAFQDHRPRIDGRLPSISHRLWNLRCRLSLRSGNPGSRPLPPSEHLLRWPRPSPRRHRKSQSWCLAILHRRSPCGLVHRPACIASRYPLSTRQGKDVLRDRDDAPLGAWLDCGTDARLLFSTSPAPANPSSRNSVSSRAGTGLRCMLDLDPSRRPSPLQRLSILLNPRNLLRQKAR